MFVVLTATECIDRRCVRPDSELIRDEPEEELIEEIALISEIRNVLQQTLANVEMQQKDNIAARERLEFDWSDKKDAFEIEMVNCRLDNKSRTSLFRPGATISLEKYVELLNTNCRCIQNVVLISLSQTTPEYWEHFTKHALENAEECRQKSVSHHTRLN